MTARQLIVRAGAAAALVLVALGSQRVRHTFDLTADRSLTLTSQTRQIVSHVHQSTQLIAVAPRDSPGRAEAAALLTRYSRLNRHLTVKVIDPNDSPGETRRLGIDPSVDALAVVSGGVIERASTVTEQDVTAGLARLLRSRTATVCVTAGHGEPTIGGGAVSDELSSAATLLRANGYTVEAVDLLVASAIPSQCQAVVLANPTGALGPAQDVLARWHAAGGRSLVLATRSSTVDVGPLLSPYGLGVDPGLVVEGDPDSHMPGDPLAVAVRDLRSALPITRAVPPILMPALEGVTIGGQGIPGLAVTPLARTTPLSFLEKDPSSFRFRPGIDRQGPIVVGAAADQSANQAGRVRRTRVVVYGDVDWATNQFIAQAGNAKLLVQTLDWLTLDEDLVSVSTNLPADRPLALTQGRLDYARFLSGAVVPGLALTAGAMVWALRRRR